MFKDSISEAVFRFRIPNSFLEVYVLSQGVQLCSDYIPFSTCASFLGTHFFSIVHHFSECEAFLLVPSLSRGTSCWMTTKRVTLDLITRVQ